MTVSSEAKRTLVKSPPELWSEVSDAESLSRHLSGVQQIKITRVEPETAVEWEADGASGSVQLQPSGFGTKVTLSLSRKLPEPLATEQAATAQAATAQAIEPEPEPVAALDTVIAPEPASTEQAAAELAIEPELEPVAVSDTVIAPEPASTPEPAAEPEPERRGFFARLLKRQRKLALPIQATETDPEADPDADPEADPAVEPEAKTETEAERPITTEPERAPGPVELPVASVTADLAALEAEMVEQDEAMLTAMLDRLGAAHHRPFSRS